MLKTEILQVVAERENVLNELRDVNSKLQYCEQVRDHSNDCSEKHVKTYGLRAHQGATMLPGVEVILKCQKFDYSIELFFYVPAGFPVDSNLGIAVLKFGTMSCIMLNPC